MKDCLLTQYSFKKTLFKRAYLMPIRQVVLRSNVLINILTDFLEMGRFTFVDIKNMLWRMKMSLMGRFSRRNS